MPSLRRSAATVAVCCLVLLPRSGAGQASRRVDPWDVVRASARAYLRESGAPSVSIAVMRGDRIVYEEAFGWADREKLIPATPNTMYSLASISKPITATGVMTLVQAGKVGLDRPVDEYLGTQKMVGLAGDASGATIRRLLSHTSGLGEHFQFFYANEAESAPPTRDETIRRYGVLVAPPGERYHYSNLGFGILDYVVSRVSGQSFAAYMREQVFHPLGLNHTSVYIGDGLEPYAATRYRADGAPIPLYQFDHDGASAIYSSAHDLVRFGGFFLKHRTVDQRQILADSLVDLMQRKTTPEPGASGYGLGWAVDSSYYGLRMIQHGGGMPGVSTFLALFPTEDVVITVLTNSDRGSDQVFDDALGVVVPRVADSIRAARARPPTSEPTPPVVIPSGLIGEWTGTVRTYDSTIAISLSVRSNGDHVVRLGNDLRAVLSDVGADSVSISGAFPGAIPTRDVLRHPGSLSLDLHLRGGRLEGAVYAWSAGEPYIYFGLASYALLSRTPR